MEEEKSAYDKRIRRRYGRRILQTAGKRTDLSSMTPTELENAANLPQTEARSVIHSVYTKARYGAEPYVLAADICAAPGHEGEAGWTWYTGSAGWYFRTVTEDLLGLRRRGGRIEADPPACALFEARELCVKGEKVITKGLPKRRRE